MYFLCNVVVVDEQNKEKEIYLMGNKIKLTSEQQSYIDDNYNNKTYNYKITNIYDVKKLVV